MTLSASLKKLLEANMVAYRVLQHRRVERLEHAANLVKCSPELVLTAQVLQDDLGMLLVVYRLSTQMDLPKLQKLLNRNLTVVPTTKVNRLFNDCDAGCWPPIGQAYNLEIVLDKSIEHCNIVYFSAGCDTALVQLQVDDYLYLNRRAKLLEFAADHNDTIAVVSEVAPEILSLANNMPLPSMPPIALQILQLSMSKDYSAKELAEILSKDIVLQQQILLYNQMPFIKEVPEVSEHILGFDKVSHIALGVAASRAFTRLDTNLGYSADFWRHAFAASTYAEQITRLVASSENLDPALSYLAALFHNFGLLLFSQVFQPEFTILKKWMDLNPKVSIAVLEKRLLGMGKAFNIVPGGHAQLGESLLRHWNMPELICVVAKEHHSLTYNGPYASYVKIIQLTNQLLREDGIGDGSYGGINAQLLQPLGLTEQQVRDSVKNIKAGSVNLEHMSLLLTNK